MTDPYYYEEVVSDLQVLLEEVTRAGPDAPHDRFIKPEGSDLDRLSARFHHVLFGRRGSGKTSLLRHVEQQMLDSNRLVAWADQEIFSGLSYPDVLVSTLAEVFRQFAEQLAETPTKRPLLKRLFTRSPKPEQQALLADHLLEAASGLEELKRAPSESEVEWSATYSATTSSKRRLSASGRAGEVASAEYERSKGDEQAQSQTSARRFKATKAEHLERAIPEYRQLVKRATKIRPDALVVLDDFHRLDEEDQPRIAGYFHRVVKDTSLWLKIGTIRYWTRLFSGGPPATGLQIPGDIRELSLDRGLLDFRTSKVFLEKILSALALETGVDIEKLMGEGARDRLVLAAGGVPRDYVGLVSEAIEVARNRGPSAKAGSERVIAEDVNEAAGRTVEAKLNDLVEDAGSEAQGLRDLVVALTNHCRRTRSACFLVDFREKDLVARVNRLQNMRFVHSIDTNESLPDPQSSRYNVYLLDVSQLAAQRAWQVDFMDWTKRERRRARKLVFTAEAAVSQDPLPPEPELSADQGTLFDDSDAVINTVEPGASQ